MIKRVAILCARGDSVYKSLPGCDVFDLVRDAWTFKGGMPVIAHPPCRLWGNFSQWVVGSDEVFAGEIALGMWCVRQVERWGGVVEQPYPGRLFEACGVRSSVVVDQMWFGHRAVKRTSLFAVDCRFPRPSFRLRKDEGRCACGVARGSVEWLCKRDRESSPLEFAEFLLSGVRHD